MNYKDLDVWKESWALVKLVYGAIAQLPQSEIFGLQSQIKRSVVSIPSNIAEGCGRSHRKDSLHFIMWQEDRLMSWKRNCIWRLTCSFYLKKD